MKPNYLILTLAAVIAAGSFFAWQNDSPIRDVIEQYIDNGDIITFEARYTPEKIIEIHENELIADTNRTFHNTDVKFHPYVLFEVKYSGNDRKTKEGTLLWDLVDGEMVIDCDQWEKTHGFEDAINGRASARDFQILNTLEKAKGKLTLEQLQNELQVGENVLLPWIEEAKSKHLIVQKGSYIQLHFQNPKILVTPQTKISQCMVSKPHNYGQKIANRYSQREIEKTAEAAFGSDFTIRTRQKVFLPIILIEIANPDGSILTTYWNAVTGKRIVPHYLSFQQ